MDAYLDSMKWENAVANYNQVEEKEAEPIIFSLYKQISCWSLEGKFSNTVELHGQTGYHNIQKSQSRGNINILYFEKYKKNQTGKKVSPKNIYENPFKPEISFFLAIECYLCINQDWCDRKSDKIFIKAGKDGLASDTYQQSLKDLLEDNIKL